MLPRKYTPLTRLLLVVMTLFLFRQASADTIWVDDSWHHLSKTLDCDGIQLVVDADVLDVPAGAEAQEYHVVSISDEFIRRKMHEIDWKKLGCGTHNLTWYPDQGSLGFGTEEGDHDSGGCICIPGNISVSAAWDYSLTVKINDRYEDFDNSYEPLGSLSYQDMTVCAQDIADTCGFRLGKPVRSQRFTDVKGICEAFEQVHSPISPEAAEGYQFISLFYPVYYQGLRLYSGFLEFSHEDTQILRKALWLTISRDHGLVHLQGPLLDTEQITPQGQPQRILTEDEILQCVKQYFANMLWSTTPIRIRTMAVEYVPITGDVETVESYTLYPAWILTISYKIQDGSEFTVNMGFHAVNGNWLF